MESDSDLEAEAVVLQLMDRLHEFILADPELSDIAEAIAALPQETRNIVLRQVVLERLGDALLGPSATDGR